MSTRIKKMLTGNSILRQDNIWFKLRSLINEEEKKLVLIRRVTGSVVAIPLLGMATLLCLRMMVMFLTEKLYFGLVRLVMKILQLKSAKKYKWKPLCPDLELGSLHIRKF